MADRVIVAVTEDTLRMLERVRNKQDGSDPAPCHIDAETPCAHCGDMVQYVQELPGPEFVCSDCWAGEDSDDAE